jgi:antiphage defense system Thoeris ThsB-like protein
MAKRVFFSFHYDDVWRVMQVRNAWVVRGDKEAAGFVDAADFEKIEKQGKAAIEAWIDRQLDGTSATIVLIGYGTATRPYVQHEILRSYERGNGLLGVWIDNIKDQGGQISYLRGSNPFDNVRVDGPTLLGTSLSSKLNIPIYDWVNADGRNNIATWIDMAPRKTGK